MSHCGRVARHSKTTYLDLKTPMRKWIPGPSKSGSESLQDVRLVAPNLPSGGLSLIHSCELNGANPFDYFTELQRHAEDLKGNPSEWMPWNYRETLARLARPVAA